MPDLKIELAKLEDLSIVQQLAKDIWPSTFGDILSTEQIDYMLDWMYSISKLESQFLSGHEFYLVKLEDKYVGFAGVEFGFPTNKSLRIHKIYLSPHIQGRGIGRKFILFIEQLASQKGLIQLHLNVNRFNTAVDFYKYIGFSVIKTEDNEIGQGYLMEDFVMVKEIE